MAGAFDTIAAALSGRAQPAQAPAGKYRGITNTDALKATRARQMRAQGLDPDTGDPLPKIAPTPELRGVPSSAGYAFHPPSTPNTD